MKTFILDRIRICFIGLIIIIVGMINPKSVWASLLAFSETDRAMKDNILRKLTTCEDCNDEGC